MDKEMDKLSILIVEDDPVACQAFIERSVGMEDISIVSITNNAAKALDDIRDYLPNVIILDLELHQGAGSGLDVLQGMKSLSLNAIPYILVTTNNSSATTYDYARQLGADFIMSKHQEDYSEAKVLEFLRMMKTIIKNKANNLYTIGLTPESPELHTKRLTRRIISELNLIGLNPKAVGYQYLIDAILLVIQRPTQHLSGIIGEKYGKTDFSVERAMQNAISRAWKQTDIDILLKNYTAKIHSDKGTPTTTEFIHYYANKIKTEY